MSNRQIKAGGVSSANYVPIMAATVNFINYTREKPRRCTLPRKFSCRLFLPSTRCEDNNSDGHWKADNARREETIYRRDLEIKERVTQRPTLSANCFSQCIAKIALEKIKIFALVVLRQLSLRQHEGIVCDKYIFFILF